MSNEPENAILNIICHRERKAVNSAKERSEQAPPVSPSHYIFCSYCGTTGKRGTGLIRKREQYTRADGEPILMVPTKSLCPACNGFGYVMTAIGKRYEEQGVA
ncbi:MAG: hypothetical protein CMN80_00955 [Spongiibacter sp.]|uniref:hypothetical protein n=1 Tax=Spongiibacter sp. TaxID=2024860 RepID=UPI000C0B5C22|nr:hypothetical protein [Spongiibacter sp.]MAK42710.1 hypothetical protein [Spongiibacter sp.]|tara:strand:+ start:1097 stop:1405 length:309 start_codon:yes stop_codon:yes gene_type:complete